jgi:hypothetical protein
MRWHLFTVAAVLAISSAGLAHVAEPPQENTVEIVSGRLHLKGSLWRPAGPGPFPAVVFNHSRSDTARQHHVQLGLTLEQVAQALGPVFVRHGFVFLCPFRRGASDVDSGGERLLPIAQ